MKSRAQLRSSRCAWCEHFCKDRQQFIISLSPKRKSLVHRLESRHASACAESLISDRAAHTGCVLLYANAPATRRKQYGRTIQVDYIFDNDETCRGRPDEGRDPSAQSK